ncbi:MAG: type II toxin-antitoxin system RelE/ParE family toxin [archaeon]
MYSEKFHSNWNKYFEKLPSDIKIRIIKKIREVLVNPYKRHLKGNLNFFVAEVNQYRIAYKIIEEEKQAIFYFTGKHKDYEKWYKSE